MDHSAGGGVRSSGSEQSVGSPAKLVPATSEVDAVLRSVGEEHATVSKTQAKEMKPNECILSRVSETKRVCYTEPHEFRLLAPVLD